MEFSYGEILNGCMNKLKFDTLAYVNQLHLCAMFHISSSKPKFIYLSILLKANILNYVNIIFGIACNHLNITVYILLNIIKLKIKIFILNRKNTISPLIP